ncbi:MAG TPA: hypothetical protein P5571_06640 [Candidatus Krumholzibacteria bacterium]|nr:hypothetical protein [Candidatus Krumholzibacteria bacterium]HRX51021.1 hypothetical protein [Candidatus Krumholzibacteria bacterium]
MKDPARTPGARHRDVTGRLLCLLSLLALAVGCGGDPSGPGPQPGPGGEDGALRILRLIPADSLAFHDAPPDWAEDDAWILATAAPGSILWKVRPDSTAAAVAVTDRTGFQWLNAAYTPFGLAGGDIGFFQGLLLNDFGMHLMRAGADQADGQPPATVLRRFTGGSVGLPEGRISSPRALSVSADGRRAVGTWDATWFMDWQGDGEDPVLLVSPATGLQTAHDFRVDRSGRRLTYVGGDGLVYWMLFGADEAFRVATGVHPSFSGDGTRLGYRSNNGFDYIVVDLTTGTSRVYVGSSGVALIRPVLSWSGDRIAFLTRDEAGLGLAVAELR